MHWQQQRATPRAVQSKLSIGTRTWVRQFQFNTEATISNLRKGSKVSWSWGAHQAHGRIVERFTTRVTRTMQGTKVVREASKDEPAYLIEQEDGDQVLKSGSELSRA